MLRWRLLLGTLFIALLVGLCWLDHHAAEPGTWLFPLAMLVALAASGELLWMYAARRLQPLGWVVYLGNALVLGANWLPVRGSSATDLGSFGWPALALAAVVIAAFLGEMRRYTGPGGVTERLALAIFSVAYVGWLLTFVVQLRLLDGGAWGVPALASLVIVVKMCDTGAYTVGRLIGRHKMAPVLSPGKTYEGAVGGLLFACLGSWLAFECWIPLWDLPPRGASPSWGWLAYGLGVGLAGMFGDLAESLLKRDLGRKDSSPWMPGFGGVLDLLDSILLAAPVAYAFWKFGWTG